MENSQTQTICSSEPSIHSEAGEQLNITSFSGLLFSLDVLEWLSDSRDNHSSCLKIVILENNSIRS